MMMSAKNTPARSNSQKTNQPI